MTSYRRCDAVATLVLQHKCRTLFNGWVSLTNDMKLRDCIQKHLQNEKAAEFLFEDEIKVQVRTEQWVTSCKRRDGIEGGQSIS